MYKRVQMRERRIETCRVTLWSITIVVQFIGNSELFDGAEADGGWMRLNDSGWDHTDYTFSQPLRDIFNKVPVARYVAAMFLFRSFDHYEKWNCNDSYIVWRKFSEYVGIDWNVFNSSWSRGA